jgi:hypothetical protein
MSLKKGKISAGQMGLLIYCGLLAPMFRVAPGGTAAMAGAGAWVSPVLALPVFLAVVGLLTSVFRRLPEEAGLPELYRLAFGKNLGRTAAALTGIWAMVNAAAALRYYGESVVASLYPTTSIWVFLIGVMVVVWKACDLGMEALCRMARVYLIIIGVILALVLLLGLREIRVYHLWPFWEKGWLALLLSAVPVLAVQGPMLLILLRRSEGAHELEGGRTVSLWIAASCVTMTLVRVVVIGMFGWQTATRLQIPLFSTAKEIYLLDIFERIEALVVAVWVLSDIVWIAALLSVAAEYLSKSVYPVRKRLMVTALAVAAAALAGIDSADAFQLRRFLVEVMQYANLTVCYGLPLLAATAALARRQV